MVESPKFEEFPSDAIVTNSIDLYSKPDAPGLTYPPLKTPLILFAQHSGSGLTFVKSPKSNALPVDDIVTKSIILYSLDVGLNLPPTNNPLVE